MKNELLVPPGAWGKNEEIKALVIFTILFGRKIQKSLIR
jgi:hypothetical protein